MTSGAERTGNRLLAVPARDPRWILPARGSHLGHAMTMYQPSRVLPRFASRGLALGSRFLGGAPARTLGTACPMALQHQIEHVMERAGIDLGILDAEPVAWTGSPGPDRKTTVALLASRRPVAYAKVATTPTARASLQAEHQALRAVAGTPVADHAPDALLLSESDEFTVLFLSPVAGKKCSSRTRPDSRFEAFLGALGALKGASASCWVESIRRRADLLPSGNQKTLIAQALDRAVDDDVLRSVRCVLSHGDFTPWNCFVGSVLQVVDWEYASFRPPMWDLFHWFVQSEVHGRSTSSRRVVQNVLAWEHRAKLPTSLLGSAIPVRQGTSRGMLLYLADSLTFALEGNTAPCPRGDSLRTRLIEHYLTGTSHSRGDDES